MNRGADYVKVPCSVVSRHNKVLVRPTVNGQRRNNYDRLYSSGGVSYQISRAVVAFSWLSRQIDGEHVFWP